MKIGIFDSGLGGLIIAHSLINKLPEYDYLYLGDTARVPYGNRSQETIYQFTEEAVRFMFDHDCELVIIACNTASAEALRQIQQQYLPAHFPDRKVLGVLIPAAEEAAAKTKNKRIGVLATVSTVNSKAFVREVEKLLPGSQVFQQASPLLVPLVENDALKWAEPILREYLSPLLQKNIDTLILGCTHYPVLKKQIEEIVGRGINVISQDEVVPAKLGDYLSRHREIDSKLTKRSRREFFVTDKTEGVASLGTKLFGENIELQLAHLNQRS
ncbi:glutamate racemase [Candidatus Berkelbacteria bacterium RIFCSPLOWO2_01_FULL_50_28]|uniref:Glutamate racemase n=1 Tax=Candidatus Berkelbacteria bacterium RIFCSPLOWO2_01_FULL_50_28 TaxID=1797471 RepID=A0A1F5EAN5_9BACT|nr:MAG: glutamate racemase [Candidatus Berkelbacteria bacterium RIFCSPHIGHO2_01_FULL_50_36]OGD62411.1 MAG: glutamate racemase [Candidatus Berkelbacteria bacterium RIFCSPHIGHO2_12_FULL_50_11]OGD64448.1 MAG: glutamate racemase [Candidatus Berkelbacteria bacterium RIFCSPLOWO2_01_FULL_50_28]